MGIQNHINQHKLVCDRVQKCLFCLRALSFLSKRIGFHRRLFVVLLCFSAFFVGLTWFNGCRAAGP
jgi:hypothetical protein